VGNRPLGNLDGKRGRGGSRVEKALNMQERWGVKVGTHGKRSVGDLEGGLGQPPNHDLQGQEAKTFEPP